MSGGLTLQQQLPADMRSLSTCHVASMWQPPSEDRVHKCRSMSSDPATDCTIVVSKPNSRSSCMTFPKCSHVESLNVQAAYPTCHKSTMNQLLLIVETGKPKQDTNDGQISDSAVLTLTAFCAWSSSRLRREVRSAFSSSWACMPLISCSFSCKAQLTHHNTPLPAGPTPVYCANCRSYQTIMQRLHRHGHCV